MATDPQPEPLPSQTRDQQAGLRKALTKAERDAPTRTVCVTGATGFIGGAIVQRLLAAGHVVHGTCREPGQTSNVAHLKALHGASERLRLFAADLLVAGALDEVITQGVKGLGIN